MARGTDELFCPDGTPLDEATSALIKTLRRGWELDAMGWALILAARFPWKVWRTLATFAAEDVGSANLDALPTVMACRLAWEKHAGGSSGKPPLLLIGHAILTLARSPKNREACDLAEATKHLTERGWHPALPSYAVDSHTARGRAETPRTEWLDRWLLEGSRIEPDTGSKDWAAWILRWAVQRGHLDRVQVEQQIGEWGQDGRLRFGPDGYGSVRPDRGDEQR